MVNTKCKECKIKYAGFGFQDSILSHCGACKKEGMVKRIYIPCINCNLKRSIYRLPNSENFTHCGKCKTDDMITKRYNLCIVCNNIYASFNLKGLGKPTHCGKCKTDEMVILNMDKCIKCKNTIPTFGYINDNTATYCLKCKTPKMINIKSKRCLSSFCNTIISSKKYDGYCAHCFANLFPNNPKTLLIYKKSKEIKVVSYISQSFKDFIHDKPLYVDLKGGCCNSKRRIDLRMLINGTMLCIEIDENQHKNYNKEDEKNRYDNLFMDFSGKYVFIRYNPDKFKENGRSRNPIFKTRMDILINQIKVEIERIKLQKNNKLVEIIYICYDI